MFRKWIDENRQQNEQEREFHDNSVMSVREWLTTLAIMTVPVVNVIMLIKWAFSNKELIPSNKVNWARASIIVLTIMFLAICIFAIVFCCAWYIHCHYR